MKRHKRPHSKIEAKREPIVPGTPQTSAPANPPATPSYRRWYLASAAALFCVAPLIPCEASALLGTSAAQVMLWLGLVLVWLIERASRKVVEKFRFAPADACLLAIVLWQTLSALMMGPQNYTRAALNVLWESVALAAAFFLLRQLAQSRAECRAICAVMLASAVLQSVYAGYQFSVELPSERARYEAELKAGDNRSLREAGVDPAGDRSYLAQFENRLRSPQPMGTFALTNSLAGLVAPWVVFALGIAAVSHRQGILTPRLAGGLLLAIALLGSCLLLTSSRTAQLAVGFGCFGVAVSWWLNRHPAHARRLAIVAAVGVLISLAAITWAVQAGKFRGAVLSMQYRLEYWQATSELIGDYPLLGCGLGNFQDYYLAYKLPAASEEIADPHNFLLEIAATAGLPAMILLLGLVGSTLLQGLRCLKDSRQDKADSEVAVTKEEASSARFILAGAALGPLVAWPLGLIVGLAPAAAIYWLALPVAMLFLWLIYPWVIAGKLPIGLPMLAFITLAINLLAAGGINFIGVAGSFWLLLAVMQNLLDRQAAFPATSNARDTNTAYASPAPSGIDAHSVRLRIVNYVACGVSLLLLILAHQTAYQPVIDNALLRERAASAQQRGQFNESLQLLTDAEAADPLDPNAPLQISVLHYPRWLATLNPKDWAAIEQSSREFTEKRPRSAPAWFHIGRMQLIAYRRSGKIAHLNAAMAAYETAISLYPTNARFFAELAWAKHLAGDQLSAKSLAAAAIELDAGHSHAELKLARRAPLDPGPWNEEQGKVRKFGPPPAENLQDLLDLVVRVNPPSITDKGPNKTK